MKYIRVKDLTGRIGIKNIKTRLTVWEGEEDFLRLAHKQKKARARADRAEVYESLGMSKVKGSVSGKTYWE